MRNNRRSCAVLDYYTHTVFEIVPGRHRGLPGHGAGRRPLRRSDRTDSADRRPPASASAWASSAWPTTCAIRGLAPDDSTGTEVLIAALGEGADLAASRIAGDLRRSGIAATLAFGGTLAQGPTAPRPTAFGARFAVIAGARDLSEGRVTIRDLQSSDQREVELDRVTTAIRELGGLAYTSATGVRIAMPASPATDTSAHVVSA